MTKIALPEINILQAAVTPITPDDPMPEAGRKIFLTNLIEMLDHQEKLFDEESIHHIHQMRVATRRMRSAMRVFGGYYEKRYLKPILKGLRITAQGLGAARDLDVMLENMQSYQALLEGDIVEAFKPILADIEEERQEAAEELRKWLESKAYARFLKKFSAFVLTAGLGSHAPEAKTDPYQVRHVVSVILHEHLAQVRAFDGQLEEAPYERLHALRIEFKRLRYLVTFFAENLGTSANDFIEEIKIMQDHLGHLNDTVVALERLSDHDLLSSDQIAALAPYRETLHEQQTRLTNEIADLWTHFNTRTVQRKLSDALLSLR